jgi:hypothetical protein
MHSITDWAGRARHRLTTWGAGVVATGMVLLCAAPPALAADPVPVATADATGTVLALAFAGDRQLLGGTFSAVGGAPRSNVGALLPSGAVDPAFAPKVNGTVHAVAVSRDGATAYLGGQFTSVDGVARKNLAAVDAATGAVRTSWQADTNAAVRGLAVSGTRVYVAGAFSTIAKSARARLAAVSQTTGAVDTAFSPQPDKVVRAVALSPDASRVYAVGGFTTIGGQKRPSGAAEVLATTGRSTPFNPAVGGGQAMAVALTPDGSRMFFSAANNRIFAYAPSGSGQPLWVAQADGDTQAITATADEVFVGGAFTRITTSDVARSRLASLAVTDGRATDRQLALTGGTTGPWSMALAGSVLTVGGDFTHVGATPQRGLLRMDLAAAPPALPGSVAAGPDQLVRDDTTVRLSAEVTLPPGRTLASLSWHQAAGEPVVLDDPTSPAPSFLPSPGADSVDLEVRAVDDAGVTTADSVTVDVVATPTVAVIGDSLTARSGPTTALPAREQATRATLVEAGWDPGSIFWWGKGGKTIAGADTGGRTTMQNIQDATASLGGPVDQVVVALGTNNAGADAGVFTADVTKVLDAATAAGVGEVTWVDIAFYGETNPKAVSKNALLQSALSARGWNSAPWNTYIHSPGVFDPADWIYPTDATHLSTQGYAERDAFIVRRLLGVPD